ncbi:sn-glycerol-1-phosphate dehydrogenase [Persicimonas caeni]|uniref:sn-glycerol-1-phosphate dehydrogenase n=1 Tax=Persicimonas caeni TaxID=2292766 RepID=A0A4Y6PRD4_PERCE|nr:iron-containing alcohol dehydrogenase [Persicimonas caeni]QDG50669.1 sn-glycerol-1-phosphate dehydrogenase [Persicimonas caeni]QED31890.1 sn-glycerol-1-phosphate dehydrogenase [Persicimonas caeni]
MDIVNKYLTQYADQLDTKACLIARNAIADSYELLSEHLADGLWLVAADENTWEAAGEQTAAMLDAAGQKWERFEVPMPDEGDPICDDTLIDSYREALRETGAVSGLAVGAGTINDVVKMGCHLEDQPMAVIGTAPSMNGYNSAIAAVLSDGVKTTGPCTAPLVVIADLDVMAEAPYRMIVSGLGDLMSKPVSNSDWRLSARLKGTHHSPEAMEIIEHGARALEGVAEKLPERDRDATKGLVESLMLSGIAMSVAGSSSPASGGEHLISHFIDMTAYAFDQPHDLHGCQVGVGTLTTALLYEKLQALDPATIDIDARVEALPAWDDYEAQLRERFGKLFDAVVKHAKPGYPSPDELRARLTQLVDEWEMVLDEVRSTLRSEQSLEDELRAAEAPVRFAALDVDKDRARRAIAHSKDIRNRYTILHLAWELGVLDEWADEAIEHLYE